MAIKKTSAVREDSAKPRSERKSRPQAKDHEGIETASGVGEAKGHAEASAVSEPTGKESEPTPKPESQSYDTITLAGFTSDRPSLLGSDSLNIGPDVQAFARLICLEQASPPLSICILGEWGSGKSTFMERLQKEVSALTERERKSRAKQRKAPPAGSLRFVEKIVQIRFNAWHYADANLWASLTSVFFDQLRQGGCDAQFESTFQSLISRVAERLRSLEAGAESAERNVQDARRELDMKERELATAQKQLATSSLSIAAKHVSARLDAIRKSDRDKLSEVGRRIGREDLGADIDSFTIAVAEASTVLGKLALIGRVLIGGGWPTWLGLLAIILVSVFGIGWGYIDVGAATALIQRILGWFGGAVLALVAVWQAIKDVMPILDGAWTYAKAVEVERKRLIEEIDRRAAELITATDRLNQAKAELDAARKPLAAFGEGAQADASEHDATLFLVRRWHRARLREAGRDRKSGSPLIRTTQCHRC